MNSRVDPKVCSYRRDHSEEYPACELCEDITGEAAKPIWGENADKPPKKIMAAPTSSVQAEEEECMVVPFEDEELPTPYLNTVGGLKPIGKVRIKQVRKKRMALTPTGLEALGQDIVDKLWGDFALAAEILGMGNDHLDKLKAVVNVIGVRCYLAGVKETGFVKKGK